MKRFWFGVFVVVALLAAGCGSSDSDDGAAATDDPTTDSEGSADGSADGSGDDQPTDDDGSGDDQSGDDDGSGDDQTDDDDGSGDGGGPSGDTATPTGGLRLAIYQSILSDAADDPISEEEVAACIANGSVDAVGEDGLAGYGITEDNVGEIQDIAFDEDDADALAEVWVGCIDFAFFAAQSGATPEQEACLQDLFASDEFVDSVSLVFQDQNDDLGGAFTQAGFACFSGGQDGVPPDVDLPDGTIDDVILDSLIDSLDLDDAQVACVEGQIADGLSIQNDITTIILNCGLS